MYFEEKVENGRLYFRHGPQQAWRPYPEEPRVERCELEADVEPPHEPAYELLESFDGGRAVVINSERWGPIRWTRPQQAAFAAKMMGA